jgi:hypothetical protein
MFGGCVWQKKAAAVIILIITIITMNATIAAPLDISIEEKFNTTADFNGAAYTYTTDVTGFINITNRGNDDLYDVWVVIDLNNAVGGTLNIAFENASSNVYIYTSLPASMKQNVRKNLNTTGATHFVHIPHLKPNEVVSLSYDVDDGALGISNSAPFLVDERFNVTKIPANRDVAWKVYLNVTLNQSFFSSFSLTPDVQMDIYKYLSNNPSYYGSSNWTSLGPVSNPSTNKGAATTANGGWGTVDPDELDVTGISLTSASPAVNITFVVQGRNAISVNQTDYALEPFGFAAIVFSFDGNVSGTKILDVFATGNASIAVRKSGPEQNATGEWVVWKGNATITNRASGLTYVLRNVTLWATGAPSFTSIVYGPTQYKPNQQLTAGNSYTSPTIQFEYDGVPVIWANATFELVKSTGSGWFVNQTSENLNNATYNSKYIVIEKIYVIGTYLIKVTKHVIPNSSAGSNVFDIYLVVENLGGQSSPYVYVYDMIPVNFSEFNWDSSWADVKQDGNWVNKSSMFAGNGSVNNPMAGYVKGYWWRLNPLNGGSNGDGSYTDYVEIAANQSVVIFYQMQGSGEFRPMDAFIVGIDPMLSMNEQTSPRITIVSGSAASSYETVIAAVTLALGVVAMALVRRG